VECDEIASKGRRGEGRGEVQKVSIDDIGSVR
jgi:hypothetical protein